MQREWREIFFGAGAGGPETDSGNDMRAAHEGEYQRAGIIRSG